MGIHSNSENIEDTTSIIRGRYLMDREYNGKKDKYTNDSYEYLRFAYIPVVIGGSQPCSLVWSV